MPTGAATDYSLKGMMIVLLSIAHFFGVCVCVCCCCDEMVMMAVINIEHCGCIEFPIFLIKFSDEYFHFLLRSVRVHRISLAAGLFCAREQSQVAIRLAPHRFMIWSVGIFDFSFLCNGIKHN